MRAMGHRPVGLPGAHVSLLLRGLALPEALGRPIVSRAIAGARGGKSPSLRLHVRGGGSGPTEARWLNGAVAAAGARLGVPTPVNALLATLTDEVAADPGERPGSRAGRTGWPRRSRGPRPTRNGARQAPYTRPPVETIDLVRGLLIVVASFVIGGIPWSIIVARLARRPDPRTIGSGRTGGANAMRAMGWQLALVSGILDLLKGTAAVLLARWLGAGEGVQVVAALAAIIGHSRSVFLGLGGGRGVAPAFGGLLAFAPLIALIIIPVFLAIIAITRYSSVGSLAASALAGILLAWATTAFDWSPWLYLYAAGGTLLVWLFHTDNIQRLLAGTERKIGTPAEPAPEPVGARGAAQAVRAGQPVGAVEPHLTRSPRQARITRGSSRPSRTR